MLTRNWYSSQYVWTTGCVKRQSSPGPETDTEAVAAPSTCGPLAGIYEPLSYQQPVAALVFIGSAWPRSQRGQNCPVQGQSEATTKPRIGLIWRRASPLLRWYPDGYPPYSDSARYPLPTPTPPSEPLAVPACHAIKAKAAAANLPQAVAADSNRSRVMSSRAMSRRGSVTTSRVTALWAFWSQFLWFGYGWNCAVYHNSCWFGYHTNFVTVIRIPLVRILLKLCYRLTVFLWFGYYTNCDTVYQDSSSSDTAETVLKSVGIPLVRIPHKLCYCLPEFLWFGYRRNRATLTIALYVREPQHTGKWQLQALVYDIVPPTTAITDHAIGLKKTTTKNS